MVDMSVKRKIDEKGMRIHLIPKASLLHLIKTITA